jgi:hypothetical protein
MTQLAATVSGSISTRERVLQTGRGPADDQELASLVQQSLRELAKVDPRYAMIYANRPGARLAAQVVAGYVERVSRQGRAAMQRTYTLTQAAAAVEPGLDTNTVVDRATGRANPRHLRSL